MVSVVMYSIQTNVAFTLGYILPDTLPVYYLPKRLLINFLIAFALAFGVNMVIVPVTSRSIFLVFFIRSLSHIAIIYCLFNLRIRTFASAQRLSHWS